MREIIRSIASIPAFAGADFFNSDTFWSLIFRFSFNLIISLIIVRFIYYHKSKRRDYVFTYSMINTMVFLLAYLLSDVELKLGFAFGLFALFGILRYRTNQVQIKEMTYLFVLIGIAVINSISRKYIPYTEVLVANVSIIIMLWLYEYAFFLKHESSQKITYNKIDLLKKVNRPELIKDLKEHTGLQIHRVDVVSINFIKQSARIIVYYYEQNKAFNLENSVISAGSKDDPED